VFVSVLRGAVERDFLPIPLTGRERELAMFLAVAKRPADGHHLAQSLWNDSGSGRGLVKVNVHRLRAKLGREAIVTELSAYRFGDTVRVDVRELELLMDARSDDFVSEADRETRPQCPRRSSSRKTARVLRLGLVRPDGRTVAATYHRAQPEARIPRIATAKY